MTSLFNQTTTILLKTVPIIFILLMQPAVVQGDEAIFSDNFNRPDSPSLGAPWIEANEVSAEFISSNGSFVGPGFVELSDSTLVFHYIPHSQKPNNRFSSPNGAPAAFVPLARSISVFPATVSFSFIPHQDERIMHDVGLMFAADGFDPFTDVNGVTRSFPKNALAVTLSRSSLEFSNSDIAVQKYENGTRIELARKALSFQFEFGQAYSVTFRIAGDFSTTIEVSNGIDTEILSAGPTAITTPFDQLFATDVQGGVSNSIQSTQGDFLLHFDDIVVADAVRLILIDIKPGSNPNCFNTNGHGVIPVAILGSDTFDVSDIDNFSLSFGGLAVRIRGKKGPLCNGEYSNGDAFLDLVCHFEDDAEHWSAGGEEATLTGTLLDGSGFEGTDSICVVP